MELDSCPLNEDDDKENIPPAIRRAGCPPAPRFDTGSFDYSLVLGCGQDSSFEPGMTIDSSMTSSTENSDIVSSLLSVDNLFISEELRGPRVGKQVEVVPTIHTHSQEVDYETWNAPQAPRPDTGIWSSGTENVSPGAYDVGNQKTWALGHCREQPQPNGIAQSASPKPVTPDHGVLSFESPPESVPIRSTRWNLGLGLTLDDIAEPCGSGSSIGEISLEFADESFFGIDLDLPSADLTFNNLEASPALAKTRPRNSVGSAPQESGSGTTPRLKTFSPDDQENDDRQRRQGSTGLISQMGQVSYSRGSMTDTNVFMNIEQSRFTSQTGQGGWFRGATRHNVGALGFAAEEHLNHRDRALEEQRQPGDIDVFGLLPPIEL